MQSDKEVKAQFKSMASKNPDAHYPTAVLRDLGFHRNACSHCGKFFWSQNPAQSVCGDAVCSGGFRFVNDSPAKKPLGYLESWQAFSQFFKKKGYLELQRYPVVARWRDDVYWVGASVYPFQPFVVSGDIKPRSNAVVIPQLSLRFNDIDNVGLTGSHYVCFDMFGQLRFEQKKDYNMETYWREYFDWLTNGMGVPAHEWTVHEDAWAGGGAFGPCMEFFSRGMEIGNQVYMQYRKTDGGYEELGIKVLDMGQGHERVPWFTSGGATSYETTFPTAIAYLNDLTGIKADPLLMQKFLPFAGLLNVDEIDDIDATWKMVGQKTGVHVDALKKEILPLQALYSIAEHSRAALVALNDGALPSNVGGGYNLRTILRRAFGFEEKFDWKTDWNELLALHADFLKPLYPELSENLFGINRIVDAERKKFRLNRSKAHSILERVLKESVSVDKLVELYDSQGIEPVEVSDFAKTRGQQVVVPENFYSLVSERHEKKTGSGLQTHVERALPLEGDFFSTEKLFWRDWALTDFDSDVLALSGTFVILRETAFYPTSGGQLHDLGTLNGIHVVDVFKWKNEIIVHELASEPAFRTGDKVHGSVDKVRRRQLMQHHTGAHVVNAAARLVLGFHVWQAGAAKTVEKGRLDITHFENLTETEMKSIEREANEIISKNISVKKEVLAREVAEEKYGMRIYQGGFIPGRLLRIVAIGELDIEACGGTHANSTGELEILKITGSSKIQDGIIRINYTCGSAARQTGASAEETLKEVAHILGVKPSQVPARAEEVFAKWKKARKGKGTPEERALTHFENVPETPGSADELLKAASRTFASQPEHVARIAKRFLDEIKKK